MADASQEARRGLARRHVPLDRAAGLVERGLELAVTLSQGAFVSVATGARHTLALKRDGSLWAWGGNYCGQLGLGDDEGRDGPTRIGGDSDWAAVATGSERSLALKRDGSLWAWGADYDGQLGLDGGKDRNRPTRIGGDSDWAALATGFDHTLALKRDNSLWAWGSNGYGQLGLGDAALSDCPTGVSPT